MQTPDAVEAAFYGAFAATDVVRMREVWAETADCLCVHPAGLPIGGYDAVIASWTEILGGSTPIELRCERVSRIVTGDTVVSTVYEHFTPPGGNADVAPVLATNIYRRVGTSWKMVLHHASPVVIRPLSVPRGSRPTHH